MTPSLLQILPVTPIKLATWHPIGVLKHQKVTRYVQNPEASRAFYQSVLSLSQSTLDRQDASAVTDDHTTLEFKKSWAGPPEKTPLSPQSNHWAFTTVDPKGIVATLKERGVPFIKTQVPNTSLCQYFFQDPDGYHIELLAGPTIGPTNHRPTQLHHLSRTTNQLEQDSLFLTEVVGLKKMDNRPDFDVDGAWLTDGTLEYHLVKPDHPHRDGLGDTWTFAIKDPKKAALALRSSGLVPYEERHSVITSDAGGQNHYEFTNHI